jgi:drug/metabolite transporter (DMT)-like permease
MGELIAICALIMFSVNVIITKVASGRVDLNTGFLISISVNVLFSGLVLVTMLLTNGQTIEFHAWGFFMFVLSGLFASYLGRYLYFDSIAKLGPSKASTFLISNPLFTAVFSWLIFKEKLHAMELFAMLFALIGLFIVSYVPANSREKGSVKLREVSNMRAIAGNGKVSSRVNELGTAEGSVKLTSRISELDSGSREGHKTNKQNYRRASNWQSKLRGLKRLSGLAQPGFMLALMGSICYALGNITRGSAIQDWNEPVLGGFLGALTGLVLQLLLNKSTRTFLIDLRKADKRGVWLYGISGILTISGQIGHIAAMHYIPISIATMITNSQPLLVIPLSYFLLKNQEGITVRTIGGSLMVLAGIGMITLY